MFDITAAEKEAREELAKEQLTAAKSKIKDSLKKIAAAEAVVANLRREHEVLMRTVAGE